MSWSLINEPGSLIKSGWVWGWVWDKLIKGVTGYIVMIWNSGPSRISEFLKSKSHGLIINFVCRASIWTQISRKWWRVPESQIPTTSFGQTKGLWQKKDHWSVIHITILDALTHGPAPIPTVTEFRLPPESSEPCSYSIEKWIFLLLYTTIRALSTSWTPF